MTWMAFFLAFVAWFGIVPMMAIVRDDLGLTTTQVAIPSSPPCWRPSQRARLLGGCVIASGLGGRTRAY